MTKRIITVGIASFGMSGRVFHAPLLSCHPGFRLKTIVERSKNEARLVYPGIHSARSVEELLDDEEIELVVINTPDHTHAEYTHKALKAGKHVIVEKPFTLHTSECEDLLNLALRLDRKLTVFQNRRWDGDFLTVQQIINSGALGRLVDFEARFSRFRNYIQPNSWKEDASLGTGTLYNLGSHLIDQALVLFGIPDSIFADIRTLRSGGQVDDFFHLLLNYEDLSVALKASYLVKEAGPRYSLHGTHGSFIKYGLDPQEESLKAGHLPTMPNWGEDNEALWGTLNTEANGAPYKGQIRTIPGNYMAFYHNVYEALVRGAELLVKPQDAIKVVKVIEASIESFETGRAIDLS